ncbi:MAG: cell division protein FtsQ/DivIB [Chitinophagaceae bacterium]
MEILDKNIEQSSKKQLLKVATKLMWVLIGVATIVLFGAALQLKNNKQCTGIKVEITGVEEHLFINEKDVLQIINERFQVMNKKLSDVDLRAIEWELTQTPWVKQAQLYFDNQQVLQVKLIERQPIARIFTVQNTSFYVDSSGLRLPLSEKLSAKVPMFTNFPSNNNRLSKPDSLLLQQIVLLGKYIVTDTFFNAQIAQIDINNRGVFELIPTIGNHIIQFGAAEQIEQKFGRLFTFYKNAWLQNGIHTYEKLDLQFNNQIVATKRGTAKAIIDSVQANLALQNLMMGSDGSLTNADSSSMKSSTFVDAKKLVAPKKDSVVANKKVAVKPVVKKDTQKKLVNKVVANNKTTNKSLSTVKKEKSAANKQVPKAVMKQKP